MSAALAAACGSRTALDAEPSDGGSSVEPPDAAAAACSRGSRPIGETLVDLYFILDRSRSMGTVDPGALTSRWGAVSSALTTFFEAPASARLGAGIAFFPRMQANGQAVCDPAVYAEPVVPIDTLPGVAPAILRAIAEQTLTSSSPTTPALDGAHRYVGARQQGNASRTGAVVLVTDGVPRDCNSTVAQTAMVAAAALAGPGAVKTYVLGVGPSLANLNAIAAAGGTAKALLVESGGEKALLAALEAIRSSALTCDYVLPPKAASSPLLDDAEVVTRGDDGARAAVPRVANGAACGLRPGWFYDPPPVPGGARPVKVTLCPASCEPLLRGTGHWLDVAIGCSDPARSDEI